MLTLAVTLRFLTGGICFEYAKLFVVASARKLDEPWSELGRAYLERLRKRYAPESE
jgi:hypothetical protein